MSYVKILPTILIIINIVSAILYLSAGDYRKMIYWFAAALLTASVTF